MFSGIVEAVGKVQSIKPLSKALQISIEKPKSFDDLNIGDSVAVDGVCLTVESYDEQSMNFTLADETLKITGWSEPTLLNKDLNLERSLRIGDRNHGHLVAGHVDAVGSVVQKTQEGASLWFWISFPKSLAALLWKKGSVSLRGVSLTINDIKDNQLSVCLIPETLKRTNLKELNVGDSINLEVDNLARAMVNYLKVEGTKPWN